MSRPGVENRRRRRIDRDRRDVRVGQGRDRVPARAAIGALEKTSTESAGKNRPGASRHESQRRNGIDGHPGVRRLPARSAVAALGDAVRSPCVERVGRCRIEHQGRNDARIEPGVGLRPGVRAIQALRNAAAQGARVERRDRAGTGRERQRVDERVPDPARGRRPDARSVHALKEAVAVAAGVNSRGARRVDRQRDDQGRVFPRGILKHREPRVDHAPVRSAIRALEDPRPAGVAAVDGLWSGRIDRESKERRARAECAPVVSAVQALQEPQAAARVDRGRVGRVVPERQDLQADVAAAKGRRQPGRSPVGALEDLAVDRARDQGRGIARIDRQGRDVQRRNPEERVYEAIIDVDPAGAAVGALEDADAEDAGRSERAGVKRARRRGVDRDCLDPRGRYAGAGEPPIGAPVIAPENAGAGSRVESRAVGWIGDEAIHVASGWPGNRPHARLRPHGRGSAEEAARRQAKAPDTAPTDQSTHLRSL